MNGTYPLRLVLAAAALCLVSAPPAFAHDTAPAHGCAAPSRPADDQDDVSWQHYLDDVDAFRTCISAFADANRHAAQMHNQAANAATRDWNGFVKRELNVPQDYPWPPPARNGADETGGNGG